MYTRGLLPSAASKAEVGAESCIQAGAPQEPLNWDGATRAGDGNGLEEGSPHPARVSPAGCRTWQSRAQAARSVWRRQWVIHVQPFPSLETFLACGSSQLSCWLTLV